MKKSLLSLVMAASMAAGMCVAPTVSFADKRSFKVVPKSGHGGHHGHSNRNRNIGIGLAVGTAAAILLSQGARASSRDDDDGYSHREQCRRWDRRCDDGSDWACRKVRREC